MKSKIERIISSKISAKEKRKKLNSLESNILIQQGILNDKYHHKIIDDNTYFRQEALIYENQNSYSYLAEIKRAKTGLKEDISHHTTFFVFLILLLALSAIFFNPTITGKITFSPSETKIIPLNTTFTGNESFSLNLTNISSISISGTYEGKYIKIIVQGKNRKYTLYETSKRRKTPLIIGNIVGEKIALEDIEILNYTNKTKKENITITKNNNISKIITNNNTINNTKQVIDNITNTTEIINNITNTILNETNTTNVTKTNFTENNTNLSSNITIETNTTTEINTSINNNSTNITSINNETTNNFTNLTNITTNITINITTNNTQNISINQSTNETNNDSIITIKEFSKECGNACLLANEEIISMKIISDGKVYLENLEVKQPKIVGIKQIKQFDNKEIFLNETLNYDGREYFVGGNYYDAISSTGYSTFVEKNNITIIPKKTGLWKAQIYASDGEDLIISKEFYILVKELNETNITNSTINITNSSIKIIQEPARINEPVRWKVIGNEEEINNYKLPKLAKIIENNNNNNNNNKNNKKSNQKEIIYETPAPQSRIEKKKTHSFIQEISAKEENNNKITNITSYIDVPEGITKEGVIIRWLEENKKITDYWLTDENKDGNNDRINYLIPHLSNQTFEINITILNVQSYPTVGGNWTVRFTTIGEANLTINAINGTSYGNELPDDLKPLVLKCGEEEKSFSRNGNVSRAGMWNCNNTGYWTSQVMTSGKHHQKFEFGKVIAYADNNAFSCGSTISSSVTFDADLTGCSGSGLVFGANDVVIDCAGYKITGIQTGGSRGFYASSKNNITVKNCNIRGFQDGIGFSTVSNASILNNNITNMTEQGMDLTNIDYNNINNNIVNDTVSYGIYLLTDSDQNNVTNNIVYDISNIGIYVYVSTSENNLIKSNEIYNTSNTGIKLGSWTSSAGIGNIIEDNLIYEISGYGIHEATDYAVIENNTLHDNSVSGMIVYSANFANITKNKVYNNTQNGILVQYSNDLIIDYNRLYENTQRGIFLTSINRSRIAYNNITNNWESGSYGSGFYASYYLNNTIDHNRITGSGNMGLRSAQTSENNIFSNNIIANNSKQASTREIIFQDSGNIANNNLWTNNTIDATYAGITFAREENTTFQNSKIIVQGIEGMNFGVTANYTTLINVTWEGTTSHTGGHYMWRKWWFDLIVKDNSGTPLQNANVSVYDNTQTLIFSELTGADGKISRKNLTEYFSDGSTTIYYSNYTINVTRQGYEDDNQQINLTTNYDLSVNLSSNYPVINWKTPTPNDGIKTIKDYAYLNTTINDSSNTSAFFDWNNSLLGYWSFDDYDSNYVNDNSSYKNNASYKSGLSSNNIVTGKFGKAINFTDTNDFLEITNDGNFDIGTENFTWEFWINPRGWDATTYTDQYIYSKFQDSSNKYYIRFRQADYFQFYGVIGGTSYNYQDTTITKINNDEWQHIVVLFNRSSDTFIIYRNGQLSGETNTASGNGIDFSNTGNGRIGSYSLTSTTGTGTINGSLDEFRMYNRLLSAEEIKASYNNTVNRLYHNFTNLIDGNNYSYKAYAINEYGNLNISAERTIIINKVPNTPTIIINSTDGTNTSDQDLNCQAVISDDNSDKMNVSVKWYKNGVLDISRNYNNSYASGTTFTATLGSGNTSVGEEWNCSIRLFDGSEYNSWTSSSNITIVDECNPSGMWNPAKDTSCSDKNISVDSLTINNGKALTLNNITLVIKGNTIINGVLNFRNSLHTLWANNNLTITGNFTLSNATLRMNVSKNGEYGINVTSTGNLFINESGNMTNGENNTAYYWFNIQNGAEAYFNDAYVSKAGWETTAKHSGLWIDTPASIDNTTLNNRVGIYLSNNAKNSNLTRLTIDGKIEDDNINGIIISANNTLLNNSVINNINGTANSGIKLINTASNNLIENINVSEGKGIIITDSSSNNNFTNIIITSSLAGNLVSINGTGTNNRFVNINATTTDATSNALKHYTTGSVSNLFENSTFSSSGTDISLSDSGTINFTNVTFTDESFVGSAKLNRFWFYQLTTNNQFSNPENNVAVNITDKYSTHLYDGITGSDGKTSYLTLLEYWKNSSEQYFYTNFTISLSKTGFDDSSFQTNLTNNFFETKELVTSTNNCNPDSNANWFINSSLSCSNSIINAYKLNISSTGELNLTNVTVKISDNSYVYGNITIKDSKNSFWNNKKLWVYGNYYLVNSSLRMNGTTNGSSGIYVNNSGNFVANQTSIISNGETTGANYQFTSNGTITLNNVNVSNAGWTGTGSQAGLHLNGVSTIENTDLNNYVGLILDSGSSNSIINYSRITGLPTSQYGIYSTANTLSIDNLNVTNINYGVNFGTNYGIYLGSSNYSNVTHVIIKNIDPAGILQVGEGIYLNNINNVILSDIQINNVGGTVSGKTKGVEIITGNNLSIDNINFSDSQATAGSDFGISLKDVVSSSLSNSSVSNFSGGSSTSHYLFDNLDNSIIKNLTSSTTDQNSFNFYSTSTGNSVYDLKTINGGTIFLSADNQTYENIEMNQSKELQISGSNVTINNLEINNPDSNAIILTNEAGASAKVYDSTIDYSGIISLGGTACTDGYLKFYNTTFNESQISIKTGNCYFVPHWYVRVHVNNSDSQEVDNAIVNVTNVSNSAVFNGLTTSGYTNWFNITEYWKNYSLTITQNNHTFNVSKSTQGSNSTTKNVTSSQTITLTIDANLVPTFGSEKIYVDGLLDGYATYDEIGTSYSSDNTATNIYSGHSKTNPGSNYRAFFNFNTTKIDDNASISKINLSLYLTGGGSHYEVFGSMTKKADQYTDQELYDAISNSNYGSKLIDSLLSYNYYSMNTNAKTGLETNLINDYFAVSMYNNDQGSSNTQQTFYSSEYNNKPFLIVNYTIKDYSWIANNNLTVIDLDGYFSDGDGDNTLTYTFSGNSSIQIIKNITTNILTFVPNTDFTGTETITITGTDPYDATATSNSFDLTVYSEPSISNLQTSPEPQGYGLKKKIDATITDIEGVSTARVEITPPGSSAVNYSMTNTAGNNWKYNYTGWKNGSYSYKVWANSTNDHWGVSSTSTFTYSANTTVLVQTVNTRYDQNQIINLTDGTYNPSNQSIINNTGSTNFSAYVYAIIDYWNATQGLWVLDDVVLNNVGPYQINVSENLSLFSLWNSQSYNTSSLSYGAGTYRVKTELRDDSNNLLQGTDGNYWNDSYQFSYSNNTKPLVTYINLTPTIAYSNNDLYLNLTCLDPNLGDTITAKWELYKDGVNQTSLAGSQTISSNTNTLVRTISSSLTTKNEEWSARAVCNDSNGSGSWEWITNNVSISNSLPTIQTTISPVNPLTTDTLLGYCNATDNDNDKVSYYYRWYLNDVLNKSGSYQTGNYSEDDTEDAGSNSGVTNGNYAYDEGWNTNAYVAGTTEGNIYINYTKPSSVTNAIIEHYQIADAGCTKTNYLYCNNGGVWTTIDTWIGGENSRRNDSIPTTCYDDESIVQLKIYLGCANDFSLSYSRFYEEKMWWEIPIIARLSSGSRINVDNISSSDTNKEQNWILSCLANDGTSNSTWFNSSNVIINNTSPNTSTTNIISTGQGLKCYSIISDEDNDTLNVSVKWYKNGIINQTTDYNNSYANGTKFNATLDNSYTNIGENWSCSIRTNDGTSWSAWENSSNITIRTATPFISEWKTDNAGTSNNNQITLPLVSTGNYNFFVEWGDGNSDLINTYTDSAITHTYSLIGNYTINITGIITGWQFSNDGDKSKITIIKQWGDLRSGNVAGVFYGCNNLNITATDILNLSGTTTLQRMFRDATTITTIPNIENWDTSKITSTYEMFYGATKFNQSITGWNTSNIVTMYGMFNGATKFNGNVSNWDTHNVTEMRYLFYNAINFDKNLSSWNISSVTIMQGMFYGVKLSTNNYDSLLTGWAGLPTLQNTVIFGGGNSQYCAGENARDNTLIGIYNWGITDGGKDPTCNIYTPNTPTVTINSTDGTNRTGQDLNCQAVITDNDGNALNVTTKWYKNGVENYSQDYNNSYANGTLFNATLSSSYTKKNQNWSCSIRTNDGSYSNWGNSTNLTILNTIPSIPTLVYPSNDSITYVRKPEFNWTDSSDIDVTDGVDILTYEINLTNAVGACYTTYTTGITTSNWTSSSALCVNDNGQRIYNWSVRVYDGQDYSAWTTFYNFTISSLVDILLVDNSSDMGNINRDVTSNTTTTNNPLELRNDGNVYVNLSIAAESALWSSVNLNTSYFQYKTLDNESNSFNSTLTPSGWLNITNVSTILAVDMNYDNSSDQIFIHFQATGPHEEPPGTKEASLNITAEYTHE